MKGTGGAQGRRGGKGGGKSKNAEPLSARGRLEEDLRAAISRIDEEGLVFLLEQANVLIHNARVEELRRKRGEEEREEGPAGLEAADRAQVAIEESGDGKAYFITLGKARKVLSLAEMQGLIRICRASESEADGGRRLYSVFSRERRDILMDAGIGNPSSALLARLHAAVLERFGRGGV